MNELRALPPGMQPDLFGPAPAPAAEAESPFALLQRFHRLLRGRYYMLIPAAAICALAGGLAGYKAKTPKYESVGSIRVQAVIPPKVFPTAENGLLQMFQSYVRTQANYLSDDRVVARAVRSPEWQALGRGSSAAAQDAFRTALDINTDPMRDPEWIRIKFRDDSPVAARIAVEQVIDAYTVIFGKDENIAGEQLTTELQTKKRDIETQIDSYMRQVRDLSVKWVTSDLEALHQDKLVQLRDLNRVVSQLDMQIKQAEASAKAAAEEPAAPPPDAEASNAQIASIDPTMNALLSALNLARARFASVQARTAPGHASYIRAKAEVEIAQQNVDEYAAQWLKSNALPVPLAPNGPAFAMPPVTPDQLPRLRTLLQQYQDQLAQQNKEAIALNDDRLALKKLQDDVRERQGVRAAIQQRLDQLDTEAPPTEASAVSQRIKINRPTETPFRPASDPRKKLAAVGFLLGGGLPVGLFMLWGLLDRRYRYSDDTGGGRMAPTLLGILPYLPDHMSNPEQAAIAAHCVHQIRTLLQISGAQQDRRVFAITSPTAGDGKTSLSLSLGLSFAASGSETCLIDFDMIGGGLSSSMQSKAQVGLMDALEHGQLNGHIRPTAFPRLSILPVGIDDAQEVSRLSPELVKRIIDEAKRRFDTVIIDTGPILGSIEASLVSAAADGVILTLGRGQSRSQAERAMTHLANLGATLIGVVFNRADPGDFRRAVSSASVRSVPMQNGSARNGRALPALGPMANTVATQISPHEQAHEG